MKSAELKQEQALARQSAHDKLDVNGKIAKLDTRLGKDIGAKRERAKLRGGRK